MLKKVMGLYQIDPQNFNVAFFLRLFGWLVGKQKNCLRCYFCGQIVSLDLLATQSKVIQSPEVESNADVEKQFDVVGEHRYFCLWVG